MLSSRNTGKYLTGRYERDREDCARDSRPYTAVERTYYDISGQSEGMGNRDRIEDTFKLDTQPIDPLTGSKREGYDFRKRPEVGP